jgi:hypothetical protein
LAVLKAELAQKAGVYSKSHPDVLRLKRQIAALQEMTTGPAPSPGSGPTPLDSDALEALQAQRTSVKTNLENAAGKLATARLSETLEKDQFAERLQVLEQAVPPQKPIKPDRPKLLALAFLGAMMAGFGGVFAAELLDKTIRGSRDLASVADGHLIVGIPYISTKAELVRKKGKIIFTIVVFAALILAGLAAVHFLWRPLDELWTVLVDRLVAARLVK